MAREAKYLDLLKEMKMLNHTGSGPVDPAPKEKETKSPVEDASGTGTKQASTGHPNVIPPIAVLKRELAKEGLDVYKYKDEEIIAVIEGIFSELDEEQLEELIKTKSLPARVTKYMTDPSYRKR